MIILKNFRNVTREIVRSFGFAAQDGVKELGACLLCLPLQGSARLQVPDG